MVLRAATLVTCLDGAVLDEVSRLAPLVRVELLPNPVQMDEAALPADTTRELVVFAGEIGIRKGADVLSAAWPEVARTRPEAQCVMVGPQTEYEVPSAERLTVMTAVSADMLRQLIRDARVVTLPSRAEGMPMVLTEAMAGGRPFVSTPVGGIPELARAGGVLVPAGNPEALSRSLVRFLADPALARTLGARAQEYCRETRSLEVIDARLRSLYHDATSH